MAKKIYNLFFIMALVMISGIMASSCSKDDEPEQESILGKWEYSETETDEDGTVSISMTLTFKSDRTGSIVEDWSATTRSTSNYRYSMDFSWTTTSDSNGNDILKISYVDGDKNTELFPGGSNTVLWTRQYVQTGKILNIYGSDGVWVFNKK